MNDPRNGQRPSPTRPGGTPPVQNQNRPRFPGWILWVVLIGLALYNIYVFFWPHQGMQQLSIPYSAFVEQVQAGNVASATVEGQTVTGDFKQEMRLADDRLYGPGEPLPPEVEQNDVSAATGFRTTIPQDAQADVVALLEQNGVDPIHVSPQGDSILPTILLTVVPILLFIGLMVFLGRNMSRGQQNVLGFGRSRAKMYDAERPRVTFSDVAGEEEAKAELSEVVDFLRTPGKYHSLGARLPRGILLVGPPGTGKTLMAKAVAGEAGVPFFSVSGSEFVEMFVGVGASRVRDLFERAKAAAPSIIFVDELDAVGRQRFAGIGGGNDEREQTLNQLLVEMDGFETKDDVVVLAATNRPDVLDPALLRPGRFDRKVFVDLPDRKAREAILGTPLRGIPAAPEIDAAKIAQVTPGFAGADLANLVNEAALNAVARRASQVEPADIDAALDKIVLGNRRGTLISDAEKRLLAYHEAGHALVAAMTDGADPLRKISIVPRGQALGVTVQAPVEDRVTWTSRHLAGRLAILMGGRVAERLIFDDVSTGAQNDLKEATSLARRMVGLWGMSDDLGPYFIGLGEEHVFLGREITRAGGDVSDDLLQRAEASTQRLLTDAEATAAGILARERDALDRLAERLIAEETIDAADIAATIAGSTSDTPLPVAALSAI